MAFSKSFNMSSDCKKFVLKNGMTCLIYSDKCFKSANVSLYVHCGSRNEIEGSEYGISHLIEHMMFKGTIKRPQSENISGDVYKLGGVTNAFTGVELTGYYISVPCNKLQGAVDILSDMMFNSMMRDEDLVVEKEVVVNELKQRESNPAYVLANMVNESVFNGLSLGKKIGGSSETVRKISREDIKKYMEKYYLPSNMTVILVSNWAEGDMLKLCRKYFDRETRGNGSDEDEVRGARGRQSGRLRDDTSLRGDELGKNYYLKQTAKRVSVANVGLDHAFISFAFPMDNMTSSWFIAGEVLGNIIAGNMMSRLFKELREKRGLVYGVKFMMDMYRDGGVFMITMSTSNESKAIKEVIKIVLEEMKKIKRKGVSKEELKIFKDYIIGNWTMTLNDAEEMAEFFGVPEVLCGKVVSKKEYLRKIRGVSSDDIRGAARKLFREKALNLCVLART